MHLDLPIEVFALLVEGFDLAGDGGMDPFTTEQRELVEKEVGPYRVMVDVILRAEGP